jgi:hypothetical protein
VRADEKLTAFLELEGRFSVALSCLKIAGVISAKLGIVKQT